MKFFIFANILWFFTSCIGEGTDIADMSRINEVKDTVKVAEQNASQCIDVRKVANTLADLRKYHTRDTLKLICSLNLKQVQVPG